MRILQVRFKNLNSLVGEWQIDLTHPSYASDGIFAITGPTGAGKTTILDAICLALYGRTPRLNKVTKSGNEIMSRQTGECLAEVTFETQHGRFRCHWSQHRARKKSDGELQPPRQEIVNADSGVVLETKIQEVAKQIEKATGMDFERFTRSMLLAQGGFAAFLQAAPDDRAPILEQITGTEIYSQISIHVHERQRQEREKLNLLQAETTGITFLDSDQEAEIIVNLAIKQTEETDCATRTLEMEKAIIWLTNLNTLQQEIVLLADEAIKLQSELTQFAPGREKLNRAVSAASLDGKYATLSALRKQQADDLMALKAEEKALPQLEKSAKEQAETLRSAEQQSARAKEKYLTTLPLLQKVRTLDQQLADRHKAVAAEEANCRQDEAKREAYRHTRLNEQKKRDAACEALGKLVSYLKEHAMDEWLVSGLAGIEEMANGLTARQLEITQKLADQKKAETLLQKTTQALAVCQKQGDICTQDLATASQNLQLAKDGLNQLLGERLLREYRAEKDNLLREAAYLATIAKLEDHRSKLEAGKPCPLCGATEHPFAVGGLPVSDEIDLKIEALTHLIKKAEDLEAHIKQCEERESATRASLVENEKLQAAASHNKITAEQSLSDIRENLEKLKKDVSECSQLLVTKLSPIGITVVQPTTTLLDSLRTRLATWQLHIKKKDECEKQVFHIDSELSRLGAIIETQTTLLTEKRQHLEGLKKEGAAVSDERKKIFGDADPAKEESRLASAVTQAEITEKEARLLHEKEQQKWQTAQTRITSLTDSIAKRLPDLSGCETDFSAQLAPAGFLGEEQFLQAQLAAEQRNTLAAAARQLDDRQIELLARQKDRQSRLTVELAKKITDTSLEELTPRFEEQKKFLHNLRDIIAGFKLRLHENAAAKERIKEKQAAIEAQKKECHRWENLHELIGSADGKKYRNFAQGLTFEMMIGHANRQLQKMSDRYLLAHDSQPLELNVLDSYQAGEMRSTKNLSGGESFIVSLSLALGLSQMASRNVRVDSLFLDEGFGTLDEEALDTALETLAGLQQDGKLIGVISHVPALKERISTQIEVTPITGGKSQLAGPGCCRV